MPAPRVLPPNDELKRYVDLGMTHQQIVEYVFDKYGVKVSRSSVSAALSRAGLTEREGVRYIDELPWQVKADHMTQYPARMLRLLGRRRAAYELSADEDSRLDAWLESLEERDLVVAYVPEGDGFIYVDNDEKGDGERGIPIRRRVIHPSEISDPRDSS